MSTKIDLSKNKLDFKEWLLEIILVALIIIFAFTAPKFLTISNMLNILRNISFKGIIAFGMTMVIISGEIDLSVGSMVGFSCVLNAFLSKLLIHVGVNEVFAIMISIFVTLSVGFLVGTTVATIVTRLAVPSFIVTLATMTVLRGSALLVSNGFPITGYPTWFSKLGTGYVGPIPIPAILFIIVMVVMFFIMKHTPFGRSIYAVGSNKESARLSGININRTKRIIFAVTSTLAAAAGIMISSQLNSGSPQAGISWEMDVISMVIIGGASLAGGAGTIRGTLMGCIFLGILLNAMTLMDVNDYWQFIVRGMLILGAVLLNTLLRSKVK